MAIEASALIVNYLEEYLFEPRANWPSSYFEQRTYSRWAASEILELVMDNPLTPPDMIIVEFMLKMESYSCVAEGTKISNVFLIAKDTAEDILHLFFASNY